MELDPMNRTSLLPLALLAFAVACGDRDNEDGMNGDSATAIVPEVPRNPRVMAIDVGLAADSLGRIIGGSYETIQQADTVYVSVRTQHTAAGAPITVRMRQGERIIESIDVAAGAPDVDAVGRVLAMLPAGASVSPGSYEIEVLLEGVSQGVRPLAVGGQ
jgi:hypothetical protein